MGNGKFQPAGGLWQITTDFATLSGFSVLSLAVTFIIPVVQAATTRRRIASTIALHGTTPAELAAAMDHGSLDEVAIAQMIIDLAETHAAFPALHFLHSRESTRSAPAMIARVGLALGPERPQDRRVPVPPLRAAIERYLAMHPPVDRTDPEGWDAQLEAIHLDDGRGPTDRHG